MAQAKNPKAKRKAANRTASLKARDERIRRPKSRPIEAPEPPATVTLRTRKLSIDLGSTEPLRRAAMEWTYIVRNRQRWRSLKAGALRQDERAQKLLIDTLKVPATVLADIASQGHVEVVIPYTTEEDGWEQRIFPWEFVLSAATRPIRHRPLTVTRQLVTKRPSHPSPQTYDRAKVLYVESAPGSLRDDYSFVSERLLVESNLLLHSDNPNRLQDPTLDELANSVASRRPEIVHLAGFDNHQGLRQLDTPDTVPDGYLMTDEQGSPLAVSSMQLAAALTAENHWPNLVSFAINNSGARSAAVAVAAGAHAAIGVQDDIDDEILELFYATLYRYWRLEDGDLYDAFNAALERIREEAYGLSDGGLVLWSADPLLIRAATSTVRAGRPQPIWTPDKAGVGTREALKLDLEHCAELNYSQLHNGEPLFNKFLLINDSARLSENEDVQAVLADVNVSITLSAGSERTSFKRRVTVNGPSLDLRREIHVPLISDLMRSVNESMGTSLEVEVTWGQQVFLDSFRVRLLPVDQWRDNDRDGKWLPSFVLPRDPAVEQIIEKAQRYVRVVRDDPSAGFDGYQSYDPKAPDPASEVDRQVQAIWSTIVHELNLAYINPPPTYSKTLDSQRLRTPSAISRGRCGTCLDLALLLAACMENIDIYPVIFLLKDHAFPGYWRSAEFQEDFFNVTTSMPADLGTEQKDRTEVAGAQTVPWWLKHRLAYKEIRRNVEMGRLVPLESVWLTEHSGFFDAIDGGRDNLKSLSQWHSMLDIARAREEGVTPLPMGVRA